MCCLTCRWSRQVTTTSVIVHVLTYRQPSQDTSATNQPSYQQSEHWYHYFYIHSSTDATYNTGDTRILRYDILQIRVFSMQEYAASCIFATVSTSILQYKIEKYTKL